MAKKIQLEADINVRDNAEASIARMRELRKEMRNVAVGSEEFRKLQAEMDDLNDALKTSRMAAGNFVEILGDIPGPLGDIASQGGMAINTLKSFGSLKFSEIKKSFVDLKDDLKQAGAGLLRLTGFTPMINSMSAAFVKLGLSEKAAAAGAVMFAGALALTGIGVAILAVQGLANAYDKLANSAERAAEMEKTASSIRLSTIAYARQIAKEERELLIKADQQAYELEKVNLERRGATQVELLELERKYLKRRIEGWQTNSGQIVDSQEQLIKDLRIQKSKDNAEYEYENSKFFELLAKTQLDKTKIYTSGATLLYDLFVNKVVEGEATKIKDAFDKSQAALEKRNQTSRELFDAESDLIDLNIGLIKNQGDIEETIRKEKEESDKKEKERIKELNEFRKAQGEYEALVSINTQEQILKAQQEFNQLTQEEYQKSAQYLQDYYNKQYEIINEQFANGELTQEEYNNAIFAKEEEHLNAMLVLQQDYAMSATDIELQKSQRAAQIQSERIQKERELLVNGSQTILGDLSALAAASEGKSEESRKRAFNQQKALAIASTVIGTYDSAQRAYTSQLIPGDPTSPIRATIAAGIAVASGLIRLAVIQKQKFEPNAGGGTEGGAPTPQPSKFKDGGFVRGRLHANGGVMTSAGEIEGGEFVVNRAATAAFLPLLESINSQGIGVNVSRGNLSPTSEMSQPAQAPVIKTYVVASDVTSAQEANKRIQNLARL